MSRFLVAIVAATLALNITLSAGQPSAVRIQFDGGRVSVMAAEATVSQVLAEWARAGGTAIVGADLIANRRITITLTDVADLKALEEIIGAEYGLIAVLKADVPAGQSRLAQVRIRANGQVKVTPVGERLAPEVMYADEFYKGETVGPDDPLGGLSLEHKLAGPAPIPELLYEFWKPEEPPIDADAVPTEVTVPRPPGPYVEPEKWFQFYTNDKVPAIAPIEVTVPRPPGPYIEPEKWFPFYTNKKVPQQ